MHAAFAAVGRFSVRFRWWVLIGWLAAAVGATLAFPSLASVTKANNTSFLPASAPSQRAAELASPVQKADLTPVPVVLATTTGAPLTPAQAEAVGPVVARLRGVADVVVVKDLGRSPDGAADEVLALANVPRGVDSADKALVHDLRAALAGVRLPAGVQAHLAGDIASQVDSQSSSSGTGSQVQGLSVLFILVLLALIFRAVLAPLVTLLPAFLVVQLAGPVIGEATKAGLQVSTLSQLMLIVLVLGAGTDYGLFLVFRVREELRAGREPHDAVAHAVSRVGESIAFSAGTVIAALLSLLLATFGVYQSLGAPLAIGIAFMLLAGLTLLPALLAILGRAVFWPTRVLPGPVRVGVWSRVSARVVRAPGATLAIGLVVFGALAAVSTANRPAGFGTALSAPAGSDSAIGNALLAKHFPKVSANPTSLVYRYATPVWQHPQVVAEATRALASSPLFTSVDGPATPNGAPLGVAGLLAAHRALGPAQALPALPPPGLTPRQQRAYLAYRATGSYLSADGRTVVYQTALAAGSPSTTAALRAVPAIRAEAARVARQTGATAFGVTGEAPGVYDVSHLSDADLLRVIPVAIAVIAVLLGLVMRSLVAPLYLIASVALSYLAALGLAVLIFIVIGGSGGLTFILPFLMFVFLLALGEDYNILVMTRIREEAAHRGLREAVAQALTATGTTVTSAGLVLAGTFAVFAVAGGRGAGGSQIRDVGTGLALGVLMDTFLVRTLLVPSTVALLGRWNWWPSRLAPAAAPPDRLGTRGSEPAGAR